MSLTSATRIAVSGLKASEAQIALSAANIANASTPGYSRKVMSTTQLVAPNGTSLGVLTTAASRQLDNFLLQRHRESVTAAAYAEITAEYTSRVDLMFGAPGAVGSIDTQYNEFLNAIASLEANPDDYTTREQLLANAQVLTGSLNDSSETIQRMRAQADQSISSTVFRINELLADLKIANEQVAANNASGDTAMFQDQQDLLLGELASLIDIDVRDGSDGRLVVATKSGMTLLSNNPARLNFSPTGNVVASHSADDLGSLSLSTGSGFSIDLSSQGVSLGGEIGAYFELRDEILPEAQAQLDEIAHGLARALSTRDVEAVDTFNILTTDDIVQAASVATEEILSFSATELEALTDGDTISITDPNVNGGVAQVFTFAVGADGTDGATFSDAASLITALGAAPGGAIAAAADADGNVEITTAAVNTSFTVAFTDTASAANESQAIDLDGIQRGDTVSLDFGYGGSSHSITFVRVDDASLLGPNGLMEGGTTSAAGDVVYGIPFDATPADAALAIETALQDYATTAGLTPTADFTTALDGNGAFVFDLPAGAEITELSAALTVTALQDSGSTALPFFVDLAAGGEIYSGALEDGGQKVGFAGRIGVNQALVKDNSLLILYDTAGNNPIGDTSRPTDMLERLREGIMTFSPASGIGSDRAPFTGTVTDYLAQVINYQGSQSANFEAVSISATTTTQTFAARVQADSGVSVDEEIAYLTQLQTAYQANARILSVVQELFDALMASV